MINKAVIEEAFETKVLDRIKHGRLIVEAERLAQRAGIDPTWICTTALTLGQNEISYLRQCRKIAREKNVLGLVYYTKEDLNSRFSLMVGALIRMFIDAQMKTVQDIVYLVEDGDRVEADVLFIPNFFVTESFGKYESRKVAALSEVLTHRSALCQQTVIRIDDKEEFVKRYGASLHNMVETSMTEMTTS